MNAAWQSVKKFIADDGMSIALFSLFFICITAQSLSGWLAYNQSLKAAHFHTLPWNEYLGTGQFLDGAFSNWQAAILQLAVLIAFSAVLRQKGAAHSRKPETLNHRIIHWKIRLRPTLGEWFYANSLSIAFLFLFLITFALHLLFGEWKYNEDQALQHLPAISLFSYAISASFWFTVFQCWEAEFGAIGLYIVLSIFLRQEHSPESKRVNADNEDTGDTNDD